MCLRTNIQVLSACLSELTYRVARGEQQRQHFCRGVIRGQHGVTDTCVCIETCMYVHADRNLTLVRAFIS